MKLTVVRGKNQFGYSFVSDPKLIQESNTVILQNRAQIIYTILRVSQNVPNDTIITDYRLFDELGCNEHEELEIKPVAKNIPICGNITLSLASTSHLDNEKVVEAVSKRIEDLKPHLDGLIVRESQKIKIPDFKIEFIVDSLEPHAEFDEVARISWNNLLRISINPIKPMSCYNILLLLDLHTISKKEDFFDNEPQEEYEYPRLNTLLQVISELFGNLEACSGISLFASLAFSNHIIIFKTYDQSTGTEVEFNYLDTFSLYNAHKNWLSHHIDSSKHSLSNLGTALEQAYELANTICNKNNLPTVICLCSEGVYSSGPNPVKISRTNSDPEIGVFSIALGEEADVEFLNAIAEASNGVMVHIRSIEIIQQIPEILNHWIMMR